MGGSTSSGRTVAAPAATPEVPSGYMSRISRLNTMDDLNALVEEAANDDSITNDEYQRIYDAAIRRVRSVG